MSACAGEHVEHMSMVSRSRQPLVVPISAIGAGPCDIRSVSSAEQHEPCEYQEQLGACMSSPTEGACVSVSRLSAGVKAVRGQSIDGAGAGGGNGVAHCVNPAVASKRPIIPKAKKWDTLN
jgi:hypothetical protein|tara:strand:- start:66 stop:428 length:363 start_codon:yes stop_codon:yes gene_type:complete